MSLRRDHRPVTEAEYQSYLAALATCAATLGRAPTPTEFLFACGSPSWTNRRAYQVLQKRTGCRSWVMILGRLGYQAPTPAQSLTIDRRAYRNQRRDHGPEGKWYPRCLNAPECTGVPNQPERRFCAACDPEKIGVGYYDMAAVGGRIRPR